MNSQSEPSSLESRNFWFAAGSLAIVGFTLNLAVSASFARRNVFYGIDSVFDTDPASYLQYLLGIAHLSRRHPLMTLLAFPVSMFAGLAESLLHWPFRAWAAILYGPSAAAAKSVLLMLAFRRFRMPWWWAALMALADILCFSRLTVGSLPESFGPTAALFALLFLLSADAITGVRIRVWLWVCTGVLLGGITISNVVPWALVLCCVFLQTGAPLRSALVRTVYASAATAVAILAMYGVMSATLRPPFESQITGIPQSVGAASTGPLSRLRLDTLVWLRFRPRILVTGLPLADAYAFTGPLPVIGDAKPEANGYFPGHSVPRATVAMPKGWSAQLALSFTLVHGLLLLGLWGWRVALQWNRQLAIPALLVVGFQYALLCFYGSDEWMLYVLQWQPALLIIMAGAWLYPGWVRRAALTGLLTLIVCEIVLNSRNVAFAIQALDAQFIPK